MVSLFEENNTAYMVMEFLKGRTLLRMVEESGPVEERFLVPLIEQVAGAMTVVHQANVIHRDIKPENIIVTPDHRAVLVDFGTAREFAAGKTRRMTTMLTPGYAPLEQYSQHARFGVFSDIYALGASSYHLLTGQLPTQATDRAAGVDLVAPRRLNNRISRLGRALSEPLPSGVILLPPLEIANTVAPRDGPVKAGKIVIRPPVGNVSLLRNSSVTALPLALYWTVKSVIGCRTCSTVFSTFFVEMALTSKLAGFEAAEGSLPAAPMRIRRRGTRTGATSRAGSLPGPNLTDRPRPCPRSTERSSTCSGIKG